MVEDTVARTVNRSDGEFVGGRFVVFPAFEGVWEEAYLDGGVNFDRLVDGNVQRDHGVATVRHRKGVCVVTALGDIVVLVPIEGFTFHSSGVTCSTVFDGEMQGVHARAAFFVGVFIKVSAARCVGVAMPYELITFNLSVSEVRTVVNGKIERDDGVATVDIGAFQWEGWTSGAHIVSFVI